MRIFTDCATKHYGRKGGQAMIPGDIVHITVMSEGSRPAYSKTCTVYKVFKHFVVLGTGNYKTCVTAEDILNHRPVTI